MVLMILLAAAEPVVHTTYSNFEILSTIVLSAGVTAGFISGKFNNALRFIGVKALKIIEVLTSDDDNESEEDENEDNILSSVSDDVTVFTNEPEPDNHEEIQTENNPVPNVESPDKEFHDNLEKLCLLKNTVSHRPFLDELSENISSSDDYETFIRKILLNFVKNSRNSLPNTASSDLSKLIVTIGELEFQLRDENIEYLEIYEIKKYSPRDMIENVLYRYKKYLLKLVSTISHDSYIPDSKVTTIIKKMNILSSKNSTHNFRNALHYGSAPGGYVRLADLGKEIEVLSDTESKIVANYFNGIFSGRLYLRVCSDIERIFHITEETLAKFNVIFQRTKSSNGRRVSRVIKIVHSIRVYGDIHQDALKDCPERQAERIATDRKLDTDRAFFGGHSTPVGMLATSNFPNVSSMVLSTVNIEQNSERMNSSQSSSIEDPVENIKK